MEQETFIASERGLHRIACIIILLLSISVYTVDRSKDANAFTIRNTPKAPKVFKHRYLTLTLPYGWETQSIPENFDNEVIASFRSVAIVGSTITVYCYRGEHHNYRSIRNAGRRILSQGYPLEKSMIKKPAKVRTHNWREAVVEVWRGAFEAAGHKYFLQSPIGIMKTDYCWMLMIGYTAEDTWAQFEKEFLEIIKSAQ